MYIECFGQDDVTVPIKEVALYLNVSSEELIKLIENWKHQFEYYGYNPNDIWVVDHDDETGHEEYRFTEWGCILLSKRLLPKRRDGFMWLCRFYIRRQLIKRVEEANRIRREREYQDSIKND